EPDTERHTVPELCSVQLLLQHEPGWPLFAPSSQVSPKEASMVPLPHRLSRETLTQWPSGACGRLPGLPEPYVPADWFPKVAGRPRRRGASSPPLKKLHPLVASADQVKRSECALATPLLVPVIVAVDVRSKPVSALPVPERLPGSLSERLPPSKVP